jgi:hypothetical protein
MARHREHAIPWIGRRPSKDGGPGAFYVFWHNDAGRIERLSLRTTDPLEAQARYAAFLAGGSDAFTSAKDTPRGITVSGALDDYWREHVETKVVAKARLASIIKHLKAFFGGRPLAEIDIPASRAFADHRRAAPVGRGKSGRSISDSTIRRELGVLQAAARHAVRWRRIGLADAPSIELPAETPRRPEQPYLTKEELRHAIETAPEPLRSFIEIAYYTGARRRSVERLTRFQAIYKATA